jgi:hypothetical protein
MHQQHIKRFVCLLFSHSGWRLTSTHSYVASVIMHVVYGKETPTTLDDPYLVRLQKMVPRIQGAMSPGAYLCDKYPILQYIPGYGRELKEWAQEEYEIIYGQFKLVKNQVVRTLPLLSYQFCHDLQQDSNVAPQSVLKDLLVHSDENKLTDPEIAYLTGSLVGAGSDTVSKYIEPHQRSLTCGILDCCRDFNGVNGCCTFPTRTSSRTRGAGCCGWQRDPYAGQPHCRSKPTDLVSQLPLSRTGRGLFKFKPSSWKLFAGGLSTQQVSQGDTFKVVWLIDVPGFPHRASKDVIWVRRTRSQTKFEFIIITERRVHPCWRHRPRK